MIFCLSFYALSFGTFGGVVSTRHFKIHERVISLSLRLLKTCRNHTFVLCSASFGCKSSLRCELNVAHPLAASDPLLLKGFLQFQICGCPSFVFQKSSVSIAEVLRLCDRKSGIKKLINLNLFLWKTHVL